MWYFTFYLIHGTTSLHLANMKWNLAEQGIHAQMQ